MLKTALWRRHRTNRNMLLAKVMAKQPWADGPAAKAEIDQQLDALLGPKTEGDEQPLPKAKPAKKVRLPLPLGWCMPLQHKSGRLPAAR